MEWKDIFLILIVLMCPLMHLLMMRGMHNKDHQMKDNENGRNDQSNHSCH